MNEIQMKLIKFTKMQGLGNDFVVIDDLGPLPATSGTIVASGTVAASGDISVAQAKKICDRRFGVGADQILWLRRPRPHAHVESALSGARPEARPDARMEILNADGSTAEMCGNGIRAVALYLNRHIFPGQTAFKIETLAGIKTVQVNGALVLVDMGIPVLGSVGADVRGTGIPAGGEKIQVQDTEFRFFEVNVGNPHAVLFINSGELGGARGAGGVKGARGAGAVEGALDFFPVEKWGPLLEAHSRFPQRTNVEFVEVKGPNAIQVRVWERGAGITLACGTGACASAVASLVAGKVQNPVEVRLPGGNLKITWAGPGSSVLMEGPAEEVFSGEIRLD